MFVNDAFSEAGGECSSVISELESESSILQTEPVPLRLDGVHTRKKGIAMETPDVYFFKFILSMATEVMNSTEIIDNGDELYDELINDRMLMNDINNLLGKAIMRLKYCGLIKGAATIIKHIVKKRLSQKAVEPDHETQSQEPLVDVTLNEDLTDVNVVA